VGLPLPGTLGKLWLCVAGLQPRVLATGPQPQALEPQAGWSRWLPSSAPCLSTALSDLQAITLHPLSS
jgi:hypothetical protein